MSIKTRPARVSDMRARAAVVPPVIVDELVEAAIGILRQAKTGWLAQQADPEKNNREAALAFEYLGDAIDSCLRIPDLMNILYRRALEAEVER